MGRPEYPVMVRAEDALDAFRLVSHGDSLYSRSYCRYLHVQDSVCNRVTAR